MGYFSNYSRFMYRWWDSYWNNTPVTDGNMWVDDSSEFIEVNLYTSEKLFDRNGRTPEKMASLFIGEALRKAGYNYRITRNYDRVDAPAERSVCGGENPLQWWTKQLKEGDVDKAKDSNILMLDSWAGGCAMGPRNPFACTVPGKHIDETREHVWSGDDRFYSNISATLHEFGHNLSMWHDMDHKKRGKQHTGTGWNDDDAEMWHRTPMNVDNGVQNLCGEYIPEREYKGTIVELYFHDCAVENFEVAKVEED